MGENNKDLLDEIDKLEDAENPLKDNVTSHEKIFTIIIILIIIVALVMLYFAYTGNYIASGKKDKQEDVSSYLENQTYYNFVTEDYTEEIDYALIEEQQKQKFEEQKLNLAITSQMLDVNNKLIAIMHNNNQEYVSNFKVQVIFYDAENKPIKIDECYINIIEANKDYYMCFEDTPTAYQRCDFLITKDAYCVEYISNTNDVSYEVEEKEDGKIKILGKSNSENKLMGVEFFIIYYGENDQIISVKTIEGFEFKKNKEFRIEAYNTLFNEVDYTEIPYSRYEVVLSGAYSIMENI